MKEKPSKLTPAQKTVLKHFYESESQGMFKFALHSLSDQSLAEVAVQETFLTASTIVERLINSDNPRRFLWAVLKHVLQQIYREKQKNTDRLVALELTDDLGYEMEPIRELDIEQDGDLQLIKKVYVDGYSPAEIAKEYGVTVAAINMRISRAKGRLRKHPKIQELKNFEY